MWPSVTDPGSALPGPAADRNDPTQADNCAAQFFWLDLRAYLGKPQHKCAQLLHPEIDRREAALECYLREKAKVQLLPGGVLANPETGWFRLCYTAAAPAEVKQAVTRIGAALGLLAGAGKALDPPLAAGGI